MPRLLIITLSIMIVFFFMSPAVFAAAYIKFEGIEGEAKGHSGEWIEIESVSYGAGQAGQGTTGATRRRAMVTPSDITVVKPVDATTPKILNAVTKGMVFPKVIIKYQDNAKIYMTTMFNVQLTGFEQVSDNGHWPREHISFSYQKIIWDYSDGQNKAKASWDVKGGR